MWWNDCPRPGMSKFPLKTLSHYNHGMGGEIRRYRLYTLIKREFKSNRLYPWNAKGICINATPDANQGMIGLVNNESSSQIITSWHVSIWTKSKWDSQSLMQISSIEWISWFRSFKEQIIRVTKATSLSKPSKGPRIICYEKIWASNSGIARAPQALRPRGARGAEGVRQGPARKK